MIAILSWSVLGILVAISVLLIARAYIRQRNSKALSFELVRGVQVPNQKGVYEAFAIKQRDDGTIHIMVNVSADRIVQTFLGLGELIRGRGFGIIEIPADEIALSKMGASKDHHFNDTYHLPEVSFADLKRSFFRFQEYFVHDGLINFGFVSHSPFDEVFVGAYKIFHIFTREPDKYLSLLKDRDFVEVSELKTISHNISKKSPGSRESITIDERNIEEIVRKDLVRQGWYHYETKSAD